MRAGFAAVESTGGAAASALIGALDNADWRKRRCFILPDTYVGLNFRGVPQGQGRSDWLIEVYDTRHINPRNWTGWLPGVHCSRVADFRAGGRGRLAQLRMQIYKPLKCTVCLPFRQDRKRCSKPIPEPDCSIGSYREGVAGMSGRRNSAR